MRITDKILTNEELDRWFLLRVTGKIGFTCGTFDLLHAGHVAYLAEAREWCDLLVVAVNSDASVLRYKGHFPTVPQEERMYVLAGLSSVDAVTTLEQDRPLPLIERWRPDFYMKGGDYTPGALRSARAVTDYGGKVLTFPSPWKTCTSAIKRRIVDAGQA